MSLLLSLAWAGPPPDGVDPDDVDTWHARAVGALDTPEGCWLLAGDVSSTVGVTGRVTGFRRLGLEPKQRTGTWTGRIEDGTWTVFSYRFDVVEDSGVDTGILRPFFGQMAESVPEDLGAEPVVTESTTKAESTSERGGDAMRAWRSLSGAVDSRWDGDLDALVVTEVRQLPEDFGGEMVDVVTVFPGGRAPARISAVYPRHLKFGTWPVYMHVYDAQSHVLLQDVDGVALPMAESISGRASAIGLQVVLEQRLDYRTAQRCR